MNTPRIILASRSAQRARLLREAGYDFIQMEPPFADPPQPEQVAGEADAKRMAIDLACRKAMSLRDTGILNASGGSATTSNAPNAGTVIIGADTICVGLTGQLLGQPPDRRAAREMILGFLGHEHEVVTGIALLGANDDQPEGFADVTMVNMGQISGESLDTYVNSDQWKGKAGGYNLFDRQKAGWPITVRGDATTVVGLPMLELCRRLEQRSIFPVRPPVLPRNSG